MINILVPIKDRFKFKTSDDIIWVICFLLSSLFTFFGIITYILILIEVRIQCFDDNLNLKIRKFNKILSILESTLIVICSIMTCLTYPVCSVVVCGNNFVGNFLFLFGYNTYIISKICLYGLFIWRVYNNDYQRIKRYPIIIKYILILLLLITILLLFGFNINSLTFIDNYFNWNQKSIFIIVMISLVIVDFITSFVSLYLFLTPIYIYYKIIKKYNIKRYLSQNTNSRTSKHTRSSTTRTNNNNYRNISNVTSALNINNLQFNHMKRYTKLCVLSIITSLLFGSLSIYRFTINLVHSDTLYYNDFLNFLSLFQIIDLFSNIICIYFGFVKRHIIHDYLFICWECYIHIKLCQAFCCCNENILNKLELNMEITKSTTKNKLNNNNININPINPINPCNHKINGNKLENIDESKSINRAIINTNFKHSYI